MSTISDFREKDFLHEVLGAAAATASRGSFDDCVIIDLSELTGTPGLPYIVYSLDHPSFVRHASEAVSPYRFYGRWVAAATCNDVVAMGARCRGFSLDLAAPLDTRVEDIRELTLGLKDVLDEYGATYEGGNFDNNSLETVGFAWGLVARGGLVRRQGARAGDFVAVTGVLGQGWVEYLVRKNGLYAGLGPEAAESLRRYKLMPVAAHEAIARAAEEQCLSSGMDLSDGLVDFLYTVADRNDCGVVIESGRLPVSDATVSSLPHVARALGTPAVLLKHPELVALDPGYDSPLVHGFTVPAERWDAAERVFREAGSPLYRVGTVSRGRGVRLQVGGRQVEVPAFWDDQCRSGGTLAAWVDFLLTIGAQLDR